MTAADPPLPHSATPRRRPAHHGGPLSHDFVLPEREHLPLRRRPAALLAAASGRVLARLSPRRIGQMLRVLRRGAKSADEAQAHSARSAVVSVSRRCAGHQACLQRSIAVAVLCRMRGVWPTWCTGVRTMPFSAHAWVAVDGQPVGEPQSADYYTAVLSVPPSDAETDAEAGAADRDR